MKSYDRVMTSRWDELNEAMRFFEAEENIETPAPTYRILHIEDSPFDSKWLSAVATQSGLLKECEIVQTKTLKKALKLLAREAFDLVVTDLVLPDSSRGIAVQTILTKFPAIPTVVLTGNDEPETAVDCIRHGAKDYFVKQRTKGDDLSRAMRFAMLPR